MTPDFNPSEKNASSDGGCDHVEESAGDLRMTTANNRYEQVLRENKINYFGKGYILLYLSCLLVYFNSTMKGYDSNMMATISVLPEYVSFFGLQGKLAGTSIVFAVFQIGQMASAAFYWPMDIVGRRRVLFWCSGGVIIATIVQGTATNISVFIGGRFLSAFFSTISSLTSVVYLVEIAPPLYRGTVAGMFNTLYYCGSLIAAFTAYGTSIHHPGSDITWKLPVYLQIMFPLFVLLFVFLIPESPRWLVMKGRHDEARAIIVKYHANGDESHPIVNLELDEIEASMTPEHKAGTKAWVIALDVRKLFNTRARRYRSMLAGAMGWAGEFSGSNIASYYLPVMAKSVGISNTNTLLLLTSMYSVSSWIAAITGATLHDRFGRRKILTTAMFSLSIIFCVMAATTATYQHTGSKAASDTMLAFIYLFGIVFSFAFTPMQQVYPAEVLDNQVRARGMAFFGFNSGLAAFINTIAGNVALNAISYNFYTFYAVWDMVMFLFIYFFFVETKQRTLEELDIIFESKNPRKASTQKLIIPSSRRVVE